VLAIDDVAQRARRCDRRVEERVGFGRVDRLAVAVVAAGGEREYDDR
jgi:hypothetical protein